VSLLSIVIVSFNAGADLQACLLSLKKGPPPGDHEIIVVDNASADDSAAAAERIPGVRVIRMGRNAGYAAANNAGIRESRGDLLLLLNSDTLVPPGALDRLIEKLMATDRVAVAGPRLVDAAGRPELSFGRMISPLHAIRKRGGKILFTPAAEVTHLRGRSRATQPEASRKAYRASHIAFYQKHYPWYVPLLRLYLRLKGEL
jgi:GT2 family glycosyltransferase